MAHVQMQAAQVTAFGGSDVLVVNTQDRPSPGRGEVLVRVLATSVNIADAGIRQGRLKWIVGRGFPQGTGLDFAGEVVIDVDTAQHNYRAGDLVWGMLDLKGHRPTGAAAEYLVVPSERIAPAPKGFSAVDAASLVVVGTTALTGLRHVAKVDAGERVLVRGAAGGVGSIAVQMAKAMGATVTGLDSAENAEFVSRLGADHVVDFRTVRPSDLDQFDVVFDTVGRDLRSYNRLLSPGGRMVTIAFDRPPALRAIAISLIRRGRRIRFFSGNPKHDLLTKLAEFVEINGLSAAVSSVHPLHEISAAHEMLEAGTGGGKHVIDMTIDVCAH